MKVGVSKHIDQAIITSFFVSHHHPHQFLAVIEIKLLIMLMHYFIKEGGTEC